MENLYDINGLVFWNSKEIRFRRFLQEHFSKEIQDMLIKENKGWSFFDIEAPQLIPTSLINPNYTDQDIWIQKQMNDLIELVLRPETTPSSYIYATEYILKHNITLPPMVVEQTGKSFRREQDQVSKNMRLKEFYQQEFQCIFAADTLNDYQEKLLEPLRAMFEKILNRPARIVESDRLPSYSLRTMDVEIDNGDKWMEICSISKRTDFPVKVKFGNKEPKAMLVLEIAIGLDRCVYNYFK